MNFCEVYITSSGRKEDIDTLFLWLNAFVAHVINVMSDEEYNKLDHVVSVCSNTQRDSNPIYFECTNSIKFSMLCDDCVSLFGKDYENAE